MYHLGTKHVDIIREFTKDESSSLSTSILYPPHYKIAAAAAASSERSVRVINTCPYSERW